MFKHYLRFNDLEFIAGLYEICEPIGFDGALFIKEQEANRYARTTEAFAVDTIELPNELGALLDEPRIYNELGNTIQYMDWGYHLLKYNNEIKGFESSVDYILEYNGTQMELGELDFTENGFTDGLTYFKFKVIQKNNVIDFERQAETKFNAFATTDINGNPIDPIPTFNYLRRNVPKQGKSVFKLGTSKTLLAGVASFVNFGGNIVKSEIDNTLSWFDPDYNNEDPAINNIRQIKAINDLVNITVNVDLDCAIDYRVTIPDSQSRMWMGLYYVVYSGTFSGGFIASNGVALAPIQRVYFKQVSGTTNQYVPLDSNISFTVPTIPRGHYLSIFWGLYWDITNLGSGDNRGRFVFNTQDMTINATQVGIDKVIKASRYVDLIKQSVKSIKNVPVTVPDFDVNGKHYDNAVFNRRMISQRTDFFYSSFKDVMESVMEVNQDYEVSKSGVFIKEFEGFYENQEIGAFLIIPDKEGTEQYNPRFMVNNFKYGYQKFAQNRDISGTVEGIHTESEWNVPNKKVENKKEVKANFIRDGFFIQDIENQEIATPTTSTENDDDVLVEKMIALPPGSFGEFGSVLLMRVSGSNLEILNRDSEGDTGSVVFTWTTLGISVGQQFFITSGQNVGTYTIVALTDILITLAPVGFTPTFSGDAFVKFKYFYSNVLYQTKRAQGYTQTDNEFLPNVDYSIKRNILNYWGSYLKSMFLYCGGQLKNLYFKNNGAFTANNLTENTPVLSEDFADPILSAKTITITVKAGLEAVKNYLDAYDTTKGYVRCYDVGGSVVIGYVQKLESNLQSGETELTLELKYMPKILTITKSGEDLTINGAPYTITAETWWESKNGFFKFYDDKNIPLTKYYEYKFVSLDGIVYNSSTELENALLTL
jgi:hypothetical protein